jgi:hypothetical protein
MKIRLILFVIPILFSCSSNDESNSQTAQRLIGNWRLQSIQSPWIVDILNDCDKQSIRNFNSDNSTVYYSSSSSFIDGSNCTVTAHNGNYTCSNSIVTIIEPGKEERSKIITLDANKLVMKTFYFDDEFSNGPWSNGNLPEDHQFTTTYIKVN